MRTINNVLVPMSDGVRLAADVYLPDAASPCPAVMYFGPYRKDDYNIAASNINRLPEWYTDRGLAFVNVDVRGTNDSEGVARQMFDDREQQDGFEMVEWIASQAWCDGNVGMTGTSYGYYTSLLVAGRRPPHLRTIVPINGSVTWYYALCEGGLPMGFGYHANYSAIMLAMQGSPPGVRDGEGRWRELWRQRVESYRPWGLEWFDKMNAGDPYWDTARIEKLYDKIDIPVFVIGGWWDRYPSDVFPLAENLRGPVKVLVGPWLHMRMDRSAPGPRIDYEVILRWFEYWLKGTQNGIMDEPLITLYAQRYSEPRSYRQTIPGEWQQYERWPMPGASTRRFYLGLEQSLSTTPPETATSSDWEYDPTAGTSSGLSGGIYGPVAMATDQRTDEAASAVFRTAPLDEDLQVTGIPRVRFFFGSSARCVGVVVKLSDVAPDGTVSLITRGYLNATHWQGHDRPEPLEAGRRYRLDIELKATSYIFEPGHRVHLAVTSADFPSVFPTPDPAVNSIYSDAAELSYLELPVAPATVEKRPLSLKLLADAPPEPPTDRTYEISSDEATRETTATLNVCSRFRGLEGWVEHAHRTSERVNSACPSETLLEGNARFTFEYDSGERIESAAEITYTASGNRIHHLARLVVTENSVEKFRREWKLDHTRDCY